MRLFWIILVIVIVILIIVAIYMASIKPASGEDKPTTILDIIFKPKPTPTKTDWSKVKFNKNDIVIAKNDTVLYTVPPRNISERDKYRMSNPNKGANIGWYHSDHGTEFNTFYSKVTVNLNGVYKEFYMPKRDIKIG